MNIENYQFKERPFTTINHINIYSLDEKGMSKYINKDSYTHRFLKQLKPSRLNEYENYSPDKIIEIQDEKLNSELNEKLENNFIE